MRPHSHLHAAVQVHVLYPTERGATLPAAARVQEFSGLQKVLLLLGVSMQGLETCYV